MDNYYTKNTTFTSLSFYSGISLWDCIVSNILSQQSGRHLDLLQHYYRLTLPVHAIYLFLLSLVFLSLLDRSVGGWWSEVASFRPS